MRLMSIQIATAAVLFFGLGTALQAEETCIRLGWSGGAAGSETKWVDGTVYHTDGDVNQIRYNWKNGTMTVQSENGDEICGTWNQTNSSGQYCLRWTPQLEQATGWWTGKGGGKGVLHMKTCS